MEDIITTHSSFTFFFSFFFFFLFRLWRWTRSVSTWRQLRAFHSRWEKTAIKNINKPSIVSSSSSRLSKKIVVVPSFLLLPQSLPQKKNVQIELWMWLLPHLLLLLLLLLLSRRETDDGCCFFFFFFSVAAALRACFALFRLRVFCCYRAHSFFSSAMICVSRWLEWRSARLWQLKNCWRQPRSSFSARRHKKYNWPSCRRWRATCVPFSAPYPSKR